MTELQFLIDLLLNQKLPTKTKQLLADRITQVEANMTNVPHRTIMPSKLINGAQQAASTIALMEKDEKVISSQTPTYQIPIVLAPIEPVPANALATNRIVGGDVMKNGSIGPRKF